MLAGLTMHDLFKEPYDFLFGLGLWGLKPCGGVGVFFARHDVAGGARAHARGSRTAIVRHRELAKVSRRHQAHAVSC